MPFKIRAVKTGERSGVAQVSYLLGGVNMQAKVRHEQYGQVLFCPRCGERADGLTPTPLRGLVCDACAAQPTIAEDA